MTGFPSQPAPRRVLGLRDLVVYGVVLITPLAPVGIFGIASRMSGGHAALTILIAMAAMALTAFSYGKMAARHPVAGSAAVYVARELHPLAGFIAGWAMFLDYLIVPVINILYVALTAQRFIPGIPPFAWAVGVTLALTLLNVRGIRYTSKANHILLSAMFAVIAAFIAAAVSYLLRLAGWPSLFSLQPFYRPDTFRWPAVATATSLAALTYIGFDGVTTLAEEVKEPERTLPVATVLTCLITGVLSCVEVYLAQRVAGDRYIFDNPETAFLDMAGTAGGPALFGAMGLILIVSCFASGLTGQASAARLLYGMARSGLLPGKMFAQLDSATGSPNRNLWLLAAVTAAGTLVLDYETAAGLLNFGAFLAFLGVNAAAGYTLLKDDRNPRKWQALLCGIGFLFCLVIWLSLPAPGKIAGCVWLALGVVLLLARPRVLQLTRP